MLVIFESILPIFLVVMAGAAARRLPVLTQESWDGIDRAGFYILFPAYLFLTLAKADYSGLAMGRVTIAYCVGLALIGAGLIAAWPMLKTRGVTPASFTSLFQGATRWNSFVALAIADRIADQAGITLIAFLMSVIIIPINIANVGLLIVMCGGRATPWQFMLKLIGNPLLIATIAGMTVHALAIPIYPPVEQGLDFLGRAALGLGLLSVGAGLRLGDLLRPPPVAAIPLVLKLLVLPASAVALGYLVGLDRTTIAHLALAASVPSAMNGYILARQMGGDAELYAAIVTLQTAAAFFTIPLILALTG